MRFLMKSFFLFLAFWGVKIKPHYDRACGSIQLGGIKKKGVRCVFEGAGILIDSHKLSLGDDVFIGRNFFIKASGNIRIGMNTHISRNVTIHTVNHNIDGDMLPYDREDILKSVSIGNYVWIGMNVNILPGVSIGDGAVIGMGTTVSRNVGSGEIVVGMGQRIVSKRDLKKMELLAKSGKFLKNKV